LRPTQPPIQLVLGLFPRNKATGSGLNIQPPSNAEVKETVELYL
jgi:hypothetical protein